MNALTISVLMVTHCKLDETVFGAWRENDSIVTVVAERERQGGKINVVKTFVVTSAVALLADYRL